MVARSDSRGTLPYDRVADMSQRTGQTVGFTSLKLLPAYLDIVSIDEAVRTARGRRILWLEILLNDRLDLTPWHDDAAVQEAYRTACRWYTQYSRLITYLFNRVPLPVDPGPIDYRDYRTFAEALRFAYHQH